MDGARVRVVDDGYSHYRTVMADRVLPPRGNASWEIVVISGNDMCWGICVEDVDVEWESGTAGVLYEDFTAVAPGIGLTAHGVVDHEYGQHIKAGNVLKVMVDMDCHEIRFSVNSENERGPVSFAKFAGKRMRPCLDMYHREGQEAELRAFTCTAAVPLQVFPHEDEGSLTFVCSSMAGERMGSVGPLGPEDLGSALAALIDESLPAPPNGFWKIVLPAGTLLENEALTLRLHEMLGLGKVSEITDCKTEQACAATEEARDA